MRKKTLTALVVALISALTVQAAAASERHHTRAKSRAAAWAQMRNGNAYAAPGYPAMAPVGSIGANAQTVTPNATSGAAAAGGGVSSSAGCLSAIPSTAGSAGAGDLFGGIGRC